MSNRWSVTFALHDPKHTRDHLGLYGEHQAQRNWHGHHLSGVSARAGAVVGLVRRGLRHSSRRDGSGASADCSERQHHVVAAFAAVLSQTAARMPHSDAGLNAADDAGRVLLQQVAQRRLIGA